MGSFRLQLLDRPVGVLFRGGPTFTHPRNLSAAKLVQAVATQLIAVDPLLPRPTLTGTHPVFESVSRLKVPCCILFNSTMSIYSQHSAVLIRSSRNQWVHDPVLVVSGRHQGSRFQPPGNALPPRAPIIESFDKCFPVASPQRLIVSGQIAAAPSRAASNSLD